MANLNGLFVLGKDAELKTLKSGEQVASMSLAYNYGKKENGQQPTQWVRATLWGARAGFLAQYLTKGKQIYANLSDVHVREYESNGKTGVSLEARVADLEFTRGKSDGGEQRQQEPQRQQQQAQRASSGFDDMDDLIPF